MKSRPENTSPAQSNTSSAGKNHPVSLIRFVPRFARVPTICVLSNPMWKGVRLAMLHKGNIPVSCRSHIRGKAEQAPISGQPRDSLKAKICPMT